MSRDVTVRFLGDTSHMERGIGRMQVSLGGLSSFAGIATGVAVGLAGIGAALGAVGFKAIQASAGLEQSRIAFTTLLGSAQKADSFLRDLQSFAAKTPFEFVGLQQSAKQLLAMGFEAKKIIPMMEAVGNAVSALGGGQEMIDRVTTALGQMRAKGKVSAEEMMQLAEAGIPAWEFLAKKIGTDIPTAMKKAQDGAIDATTGIDAIIEGMQGRFGGLMEKQSSTIIGMWSNVKDSLNLILTTIGDKITSIFDLKARLGAAMALLGDLQSMLAQGWGPLAVLDFLLLSIGLQAPQVSQVNDAFKVMSGILVTLSEGVGQVVQWFQAHREQIAQLVGEYWNQLKPALQIIIDHQDQLKLVIGAVAVALAIAVVGIAIAIKYFADMTATMVGVVAAIGDLLGWIGGLVGGLDGIARAAQNAISWIDALKRKASEVPVIGGILGALVPGFQYGGTVPGPLGAPMLAMVHGGERITPPGRGVSAPTYNINVSVPPTADPAGIGQAIVGLIQQYERRGSKAWRL